MNALLQRRLLLLVVLTFILAHSQNVKSQEPIIEGQFLVGEVVISLCKQT